MQYKRQEGSVDVRSHSLICTFHLLSSSRDVNNITTIIIHVTQFGRNTKMKSIAETKQDYHYYQYYYQPHKYFSSKSVSLSAIHSTKADIRIVSSSLVPNPTRRICILLSVGYLVGIDTLTNCDQPSVSSWLQRCITYIYSIGFLSQLKVIQGFVIWDGQQKKKNCTSEVSHQPIQMR